MMNPHDPVAHAAALRRQHDLQAAQDALDASRRDRRATLWAAERQRLLARQHAAKEAAERSGTGVMLEPIPVQPPSWWFAADDSPRDLVKVPVEADQTPRVAPGFDEIGRRFRQTPEPTPEETFRAEAKRQRGRFGR